MQLRVQHVRFRNSSDSARSPHTRRDQVKLLEIQSSPRGESSDSISLTKQDQLRARHRLSKFLLRSGQRPPSGIRPWTRPYLIWVAQLRFTQMAQEAIRLDYLYEVEHMRDRVERLEQATAEAIKLASPALQQVINDLPIAGENRFNPHNLRASAANASGLLQIAVSTMLRPAALLSANPLPAEHCRYGTRDLLSPDQLLVRFRFGDNDPLLLLQGVCHPIRSNILMLSGGPSEQEGPDS